MRKLVRAIRTPRGATAVEYLLMLILAALFVLAIIKVFGGTVKSKYSAANNELDGTLAAEDDRGEDGQGDNLGPTASYGGKGGVASGGRTGAKGASKGGDGDESKGKAENSKAFADGKSGQSKGSGGDDDDDDRVSDGKDANLQQSGGAAERPDAAKEGKKKSINPLVIIAALFLLGLLFYVMSSGKKD